MPNTSCTCVHILNFRTVLEYLNKVRFLTASEHVESIWTRQMWTFFFFCQSSALAKSVSSQHQQKIKKTRRDTLYAYMHMYPVDDKTPLGTNMIILFSSFLANIDSLSHRYDRCKDQLFVSTFHIQLPTKYHKSSQNSLLQMCPRPSDNKFCTFCLYLSYLWFPFCVHSGSST